MKKALEDGCTHFAILSDDTELPKHWWDACKREFDKGSHLVSVDAGLKNILFAGWFLVVDRVFLDEVGYMDEQFFPFYFEDQDYSQRLQQSGLKYSMADIEVIHKGSATIVGNFKANDPKFFYGVYRRNKAKFRKKYPDLKFRM
jgi:GT2 family glycosyltransferase